MSLVAYVGPGALATAWWGSDHPTTRFHARQGLGLLVVEGAWLSLGLLMNQTLGRIPFLGILIMVAIAVAGIGSAVTWSAIGIVRVLAHEQSQLPILGHWIERWWS